MRFIYVLPYGVMPKLLENPEGDREVELKAWYMQQGSETSVGSAVDPELLEARVVQTPFDAPADYDHRAAQAAADPILYETYYQGWKEVYSDDQQMQP